jgi:SAM-dependent MidA family methyltransferase
MSSKTTFSKSSIWQLQRQYFSEVNINAWAKGDVPHYVTSNPRMAKTYAEIIFGFLSDVVQMNTDCKEPVYIVELGTGSGRFSYHLLTALHRLNRSSAAAFKYVMTDFVAETLNFWQEHPRLQPFFDQKILDVALFDVEKDDKIFLEKEKKPLEHCQQPIIVIANYFFDSIPQELFHIKDKKINQVFIKINNKNKKYATAKEALENIQLKYSYKETKNDFFKDQALNNILQTYSTHLNDSHVLFPDTGINCIDRLRHLSEKGLMLLTADKGYHRITDLDLQDPPRMVTHGSFSLTANYHALKMHCELSGGKTFFPKQFHNHINVGCLIYDNHNNFKNTELAYASEIEFFGPDDYFSIKKNIEKQIGELSARDLFAYIRLSNYDARLFYQFIPRFYELIPHLTVNQRFTFLQTVAKVWDCYYPIKEDDDLASSIGTLLFNLMFYKEALGFFSLSEQLYGSKERTTFNMALCHIQLGDIETSKSLLQDLLSISKNNKEVSDLLRTISDHAVNKVQHINAE